MNNTPACRCNYLGALPGNAKPTLNTTELNRVVFLRWLKLNHPGIYADIVPAGESVKLGGLFDSIAGAFNNVVSKANELAATYLNVRNQTTQQKAALDLLRTNIERAKAGLAPLNPDGSVVTTNQIGNTATTTDVELAQSVGGVPMLAWLALGGLGLYVLTRRR
jgi:hypothetical protein